MSWRDEEYTDMERGLSSEVRRLRSVVHELQEENEKLKNNYIEWIDKFVECLPVSSDNRIWTDGIDGIYVKSEQTAQALAVLLKCLYVNQGEEVDVVTGYYDPEEDERNNEKDECTGWWYVDIN